MSTTITLPQNYGYCLLAATGIGFHIVLTGALYVMPARKRYFGDAFLARLKSTSEGQQLIEDAEKMGIKSLRGGYPSTGQGDNISRLGLTNIEQLEFLKAQRVHYNYVEIGVPAVVSVLIGGLYNPVVAAACGFTIILARAGYSWAYVKKGPKGREVFAVTCLLAMFVATINAGIASLKIAGVF